MIKNPWESWIPVVATGIGIGALILLARREEVRQRPIFVGIEEPPPVGIEEPDLQTQTILQIRQEGAAANEEELLNETVRRLFGTIWSPPYSPQQIETFNQLSTLIGQLARVFEWPLGNTVIGRSAAVRFWLGAENALRICASQVECAAKLVFPDYVWPQDSDKEPLGSFIWQRFMEAR